MHLLCHGLEDTALMATEHCEAIDGVGRKAVGGVWPVACFRAKRHICNGRSCSCIKRQWAQYVLAGKKKIIPSKKV